MKAIYLISIILLLLSFILIRKNNKRVNILSSIIYSLCFFFCYQTFVVYISGLFNLGGSLLYYSIVNIIISIIIFTYIIRKKEIQEYYFNKKELLLYISIIIIILSTCLIRFRGLSILTYISDDSSIHYRSALHFKRELKYLTKTNSQDIIYHDFSKYMPISYINGGFFLKILSNFKPYKVFIIYDIICLILYSLLFLSTIIDSSKKKNNKYISYLIITLLYILAFPLNNLLFGFFYLGLGIMVVNLIYLFIKNFEFNLDSNIFLKIIMLFILNFSLFFSYYLFVPNIYLATGLYYIWLYKNKKISKKNLFIYGLITLIIPFLIGFNHFILPNLFNKSKTVLRAITLEGAIYNNITTIYLFLLYLTILIYRLYHKKISKITYLSINIYIITFYITIFLVLYIFKISKLYYFYKLFYLFSIFIAIAIANKYLNKEKIVYKASIIIILLIIIPIICKENTISKFLSKTNIYSYNSNEIFNGQIRYNKDELKLVNHAKELKKTCEYNNEFIIITKTYKKFWFYSITGSIPILGHDNSGSKQFNVPSIKFNWWQYNTNHPCIVYFYEGKKLKYQKNKYRVIYQNKSGIILKKKIRSIV